MHARTRSALIITALTIAVFALRLSVSIANGNPSYESYFALLQVDAIRETGLPRFADALSYEGRSYVFNPLFYYLLTAVSLLLPPVLAVKVVPNLLMAALIPLVYLISYRLTQSRTPSLIAAAFAGGTPIIFSSYCNTASPITLALPLLATSIYELLAVERHPRRALGALTILALASPLAWLAVATLVCYALILLGEQMKVRAAVYETALFAGVLTFWWTLLIYKRALQVHGLRTLTGNLPHATAAANFSSFSIAALIVTVGAVPGALGLAALYHAAHERRSKKLFLIVALGLSTLLFALLKLLSLTVALLILSLTFASLSSYGLQQLSVWLRKTRFEKLRTPLTALLLLFFVLTSLLPAIASGVQPLSGPSADEIKTLQWLAQQDGAVILAAPKNGFLINAVAHKPYVADEEYLLINNPEAIIEDIDTIYTTPFSVVATELLSKYGVTHILLSPVENERYDRLGAIAADRECFPLLHAGAVTVVYGVACTVEEKT